MSTTIAMIAALFLLVAVSFILLFRTLWKHDPAGLPTAEWLSRFSVEKYRPMERLLAEEDFAFLARQPGFTPRLARRLRAEHRRVFRGYLRSLRRDFNRLYTATKLLLLDSAHDRPDLALTLLKQRLTFELALAAVHGRLALQTLGLGTVDVRGLVGALENMRVQLRGLYAEPAVVPVTHN